MVAVGFDLVGTYGHDVESEAVEFGNLDVGREQRCHKRYAVAFLDEVVGLEGVEGIAHGGCSALGGEEVEVAAFAGVPVAEFLGEIRLYDCLGVFEYAGRGGVLVAYYALGPFVGEFVGVGFELVDEVAVRAFEQSASFAVAVVDEELLKARGYARAARYAGYSGRVGVHAFALRHSPRSEQEECFAGVVGYPVGVAAPCIEEGGGGLAGVVLGKRYQFVFDFKGAHAAERLFVFTA